MTEQKEKFVITLVHIVQQLVQHPLSDTPQ